MAARVILVSILLLVGVGVLVRADVHLFGGWFWQSVNCSDANLAQSDVELYKRVPLLKFKWVNNRVCAAFSKVDYMMLDKKTMCVMPVMESSKSMVPISIRLDKCDTGYEFEEETGLCFPGKHPSRAIQGYLADNEVLISGLGQRVELQDGTVVDHLDFLRVNNTGSIKIEGKTVELGFGNEWQCDEAITGGGGHEKQSGEQKKTGNQREEVEGKNELTEVSRGGYWFSIGEVIWLGLVVVVVVLVMRRAVNGSVVSEEDGAVPRTGSITSKENKVNVE